MMDKWEIVELCALVVISLAVLALMVTIAHVFATFIAWALVSVQ